MSTGSLGLSFKFPENTRFPSLPVKTAKYGLYYPLEGESYCIAPEIQVALRLPTVLLNEFTEFDYGPMFVEGQRHEIQKRLN